MKDIFVVLLEDLLEEDENIKTEHSWIENWL